MARTRGTIPTPANIEPEVGLPLDARQRVATKADLTASGSFPYPWVGMEVYCAQDGKTYQLVNDDPTNEMNWKDIPDSSTILDMNSHFKAYDSYTDEINDLRTRLNTVENSLRSDKETMVETGVIFTSGQFRKDFLPDHEKSYFCTNVEFKYTSSYTASGNDSIFVNGKTIALTAAHESGQNYTHTIKLVSEYEVVNIYEDDVIIDTLSDDMLILTFGITLNNPDVSSIDTLKYTYSYLEYNNIRVYSKNNFPITETYEGEILYWTRNSTAGDSQASTNPNSFGAKHSKAIYSMGNNRSGIFTCMFNVAYTDHKDADNHNDEILHEYIIRYMYTSRWDFSKVTYMRQMASFSWSTPINDNYRDKREYVDDYLKRVQWDNVTWPEVTQSSGSANHYVNCFNTYNTKSYGNLTRFNSFFQYLPDYSRLSFSGNYSIESLGDLSSWDVSKFYRFDELFAQMFNLTFVGDIGKWDLGSGYKKSYDANDPCVIKNIFRFCFKLKGISSAISHWDVSNCKQLNGIFQGAICIGDDTLCNLGLWNTHNCINFGEIFSYLTPDVLHGPKAKYAPYFAQVWAKMVEEYLDPNITDARKEEIEWELIDLNKNIIVAKRTDLSFVEKWDMTSCTQTRDMFSYNPYLKNVGDLRKWVFGVTDGSQWTEKGAWRMFAYCTALEGVKMPPIPRGVNVEDIFKGCISLANIEVNELNVAAISFEDSPLTKQSVLNLINAATDDIDITLKADVYTAYASDSDVTAAIASKASSSITVQLISA